MKKTTLTVVFLSVMAAALALCTATRHTSAASQAADEQDEIRGIVYGGYIGNRPRAQKQAGAAPRAARHRYRRATPPLVRESARRRGGAGARRPEGASAAKQERVIGVTLWRLRPSRAGDEARMLVHGDAGRAGGEWTPERIDVETPLSVGEMVRVSIESPASGYLYVINRERFADGPGDSYLIFPTTRTHGGNNRVEAGRVVEIPGQRDTPSHFTMRPQRADQTEEELIVIVTERPLDLRIGREPLLLPRRQVNEWLGKWGAKSARLELVGGKGRAWTRAEKDAGASETRKLTQDDPPAQTLYHAEAGAGEPILISVPLRYGGKGRAGVEAGGNAPVVVLGNAGGGDYGPGRGDAGPGRGVTRPELIVQLGHAMGGPWASAFSPDGRLVVTGGIDTTALLWDARTGTEIRRFPGHEHIISSADFSPDGRLVATGSGSARVWDVATGRLLRNFARLGEMDQRFMIWDVKFSPDGKTLAIATNYLKYMLCLTDVAGGKLIRCYDQGSRIPTKAVAFSPDGKRLLSGDEAGKAHLWDTSSGERLKTFEGHAGAITAVAFSKDGSFVVTGSADQTARLWDVATGKETRRLKSDGSFLFDLALSPDDRTLATVSQDVTGDYDGDNSTRLWDLATGRVLWRLNMTLLTVAFSPDGRSVLTGRGIGPALRDASTGELIRRFEKKAWPVMKAEFSADGKFILIEGGHTGLWDMASGREVARLGDSDTSARAALSPGGRHIALSDRSPGIRLLDSATGQDVGRLDTGAARAAGLEFSHDGRFVVSSHWGDRKIHVWNVFTGKKVQSFDGREFVYSPDGRFMLVGDRPRFKMLGVTDAVQTASNKMCMKEVGTGATAWCFDEESMTYGMDFTPDGRRMLTGDFDGTLRMLDVATGREVWNMTHKLGVLTVAVSPRTGRYFLTGEADGKITLWDSAARKPLRQLVGHSSLPWTVSFSPDERFVLSGGFDGTARLWDVATGAEVASLISFMNGTWVVVDREGRFDTNNLEYIDGLHWVMPDDPFNAQPVEIFMRDYYEPRLLGRLLAGERLKPVRDISEINRAQPGVRIASIRPQDSAGTVSVTVEVAAGRREVTRRGRAMTDASGAYDLRLFRDGRVVGYAPEQGGEIELDASGRASVTFKDIKLPRSERAGHVEFSAYAFNSDRVKSATDRKVYDAPASQGPVKGRAFLVTVGVNAYENPELNLRFAANDARQMQRLLSERLAKTGMYSEVVQVPLVSDYEAAAGRAGVTEATATKANFKAVLDILSGRQSPGAGSVPGVEKLRAARPEDLVLISFSSHGYTDAAGNFYLVPYDTGGARVGTEEFARRSISSEELSSWMRDLDAGEVVLVIDACHSSAAVQGEGFKPGPMGSRGLGQLSYDKGIKILAATQADNVAVGSGRIDQGLLTYALTREAIEAGAADTRPKDGVLTLREWLAFGERRVPLLYESLVARKQQAQGEVRLIVHDRAGREESAAAAERPGGLKTQQPTLFDFARKSRGVVLANFGGGPLARAPEDSSGVMAGDIKHEAEDFSALEPPPMTAAHARAVADAAARNRRDFASQMEAARLLYQLGQWEGAASFAGRAVEIRGKDAEALRLAGDIKFAAEDFAAAARFYELALKHQPKSAGPRADPRADLHARLGESHARRAPPEVERAIAEYRRALEIDPRHTKSLLGIAQAALLKKDFPAARAAVERLAEVDPSHGGLGQLLFWTSPVGEALQKAGASPEDFDAQMNAASVLFQTQRYEQAFEMLLRAKELRPDSLDVLYGLGEVCFAAGQYEAAGSWFAAVLEKSPDDAGARAALGATFMKLDPPDVNRALAELRAALGRDARNEVALEYMTFALIRKGDAAGARSALSALEREHPKNGSLPTLRTELEGMGRPPARPR